MRGVYNYINGVLDGAMKRWDTQGHLLFDGHYSNGQLDGRVTQWIDDVMRKRCSYRKGHEIGKYEEWSNTGHLLKVANYILSADGENTVLDGPYSQWNENGILQMKGTYSKGMRTGTWTFWDDSGLLTEKWVYENDERVKFITGSPAVLAERAKKAEEERLAAERVKWAGTGTYGRMLGLTVDNPILISLTERPELQTSAGKAALNAVLQTEYFNFPASVQVEQQHMISDTVQWLQEDGSRLHLVRYAVKQTYSASNAFGVRSLATLWTCVAVAADTAKLVSISEPMDFGGSGNDAFTKVTFKLFNWTINEASPVSESFLVTFGSMFASVVVTPQYKYLGLAYMMPGLASAASNFALQYIRTCPGMLGFLAEKAP